MHGENDDNSLLLPCSCTPSTALTHSFYFLHPLILPPSLLPSTSLTPSFLLHHSLPPSLLPLSHSSFLKVRGERSVRELLFTMSTVYKMKNSSVINTGSLWTLGQPLRPQKHLALIQAQIVHKMYTLTHESTHCTNSTSKYEITLKDSVQTINSNCVCTQLHSGMKVSLEKGQGGNDNTHRIVCGRKGGAPDKWLPSNHLCGAPPPPPPPHTHTQT